MKLLMNSVFLVKSDRNRKAYVNRSSSLADLKIPIWCTEKKIEDRIR